MDPLLGECSLESLRRTRTSEKWTAHPPDVLPAFVAEMDFQAAAPISEAVTAAARRGDFGYPHPTRLGQAVASFFAERTGWEPRPERVVAAPDVMTGVAEMLHALTPHRSGVVINPPVYAPFFFRLAQADRRPIEAPLLAPAAAPPSEAGATAYELDLDALAHALAGEGVAACLLCSPHNPVGRVWAAAELCAVAELCASKGAIFFVDEIHAPLTLDGASFAPVLSLLDDGEGPRTIVFTSASKGWNIPGLKCGVIVAGSDADASLARDRWEALFPSHLGAIATEAAFTAGGEWLDAARGQLDENRRLLGDLLQAHLPAVGYRAPDASFLAWLDCRQLGLGDDPAAAFLERGRVALSSGPAFGSQGKGFARLNFGTSPELLTEVVRRMAAALDC